MLPELKQTGVIRTPYITGEEAPIQSRMSNETGRVEVLDDYKEGLDGVEGFSHLILLYLFHRSSGYSLKVKPFLDNKKKGVFATRAPARPNNIGISVVELLERKENILRVKGVDMIDMTPLLDIKPYVPAFDYRKNVKIGWLEGKV